MNENRQLHIEITTRCRLLCEKCSRTFLHNKGKLQNVDLPLDLFTKIVKSQLYNDMLFCGSLGDCIYHPQFLEMVQVCKDHGLSVKIITNGSGKSKQWWIKLFEILDPSCDRLDFAIDGYKETVGEYRKNFTEKDFYNVLEIMELAANKYKIKTLWTFIPMKFNEHQIIDAAKLAVSKNIIFCFRKSHRWYQKNDPKLPSNKNLISNYSPVVIMND